MISYFENEKGDYTIIKDDEPIAWVKSEEAARNLELIFSDYGHEILSLKNKAKELNEEINTLKYQARQAEEKQTNIKKVMEEMGARFKSKLMSVYYLLGAIKTMGTHHEKEVAIRYLQQTTDTMIKDEGGPSWDQDLFNIPF
jgi:predicted  nucleic acid-binding Zn-ribbon protein